MVDPNVYTFVKLKQRANLTVFDVVCICVWKLGCYVGCKKATWHTAELIVYTTVCICIIASPELLHMCCLCNCTCVWSHLHVHLYGLIYMYTDKRSGVITPWRSPQSPSSGSAADLCSVGNCRHDQRCTDQGVLHQTKNVADTLRCDCAILYVVRQRTGVCRCVHVSCTRMHTIYINMSCLHVNFVVWNHVSCTCLCKCTLYRKKKKSCRPYMRVRGMNWWSPHLCW